MKITFSINYHTNWGESLYICGNIPELGEMNPLEAAGMHLSGPDTWELTIEGDSLPKTFRYGYIVKRENSEWRYEWNRKPHVFSLTPGRICPRNSPIILRLSPTESLCAG